MKTKCYLIACILFVLPFFAQAGVLKGKVTDKKGEGLPFATVFIQGTATGTTANADAEYQLSLAPGTYRVQCQYMGFSQSSFQVTIKGEETVTHNFSLQDQTLQMKDVVIRANAEDPAYAIIRKTIARRQFHLQQVKSFQSHIYLKGVLRNRLMPTSITGVMKKKDGEEMKSEMGLDSAGRGLLYLCEQEADYYSQEPDKERTVIRSVRQSGDPNGMGFDRMPPVVTFYENNIRLFGGAGPRGFISPVSDNALNYYKYKYEGEYREGGYTIDKIKVTPKRDYEPLFNGTIYIVEEDWAIQSLDMIVTKTANLEFFDTLHIRQTHLPLKKDTWVVKDQVLYPTVKIMGFDIAGYFLTVYNNQKVNEPMPDSIFSNKIISQYDKDANRKDTTYWEGNRPVPLEADEVRDFVVKDSIRIKHSDPAYIDSMRKLGNDFGMSDLLLGTSLSTKMYKNTFRTNGLINIWHPLVSYNTVEGVVVAPRLNWTHEVDTYHHIYTTIATRYGLENTHFNAMGRVAYRFDDKTWHGRYWQAGIEAGKYVYQFNPNSTLPPLFNTFSTLVYGKNHMKIYERWNGTIFFEKDHGNGFKWNVKLNYQKRLPLENTTDYTWASSTAARITPNMPSVQGNYPWEEHAATIASASVSYRPGYTYTLYPDYKEGNRSKWPLFTLSYDKGIKSALDSKVDFDKWRFGIEDNMRLRLLGSLSYNIAAGGFLNDKYVSLPDLMHLADNGIIIASPYLRSFQLAPYYAYSNSARIYGEAHVEYNLEGFLTNKIPMFRKLRWYLVLGTNTFYAGGDNYYTEAFIGLDNIGYKWARFLRVDLVQSWNNLDQPMTGIRIGLNTGAFRVQADDPNKEW